MKILYRSVSALLAALVFPAVYFMEFLYFRLSTTITDKYGMKDAVSLKRIVDILTGKDPLSGILSGGDKFSWPAALDPIKRHLIACAVLLGVALLAALFIVVWSIVSGKRLPPVIAAAVGIGAMIALSIVFSRAAAHLVTGGDIGVMSLFGSGGFLSSLVSGLVTLDVLRLGGFRNAVIILFAAVIGWAAAFAAVEWGDADAQKEKEAAKQKKAAKKKKA